MHTDKKKTNLKSDVDQQVSLIPSCCGKQR